MQVILSLLLTRVQYLINTVSGAGEIRGRVSAPRGRMFPFTPISFLSLSLSFLPFLHLFPLSLFYRLQARAKRKAIDIIPYTSIISSIPTIFLFVLCLQCDRVFQFTECECNIRSVAGGAFTVAKWNLAESFLSCKPYMYIAAIYMMNRRTVVASRMWPASWFIGVRHMGSVEGKIVSTCGDIGKVELVSFFHLECVIAKCKSYDNFRWKSQMIRKYRFGSSSEVF